MGLLLLALPLLLPALFFALWKWEVHCEMWWIFGLTKGQMHTGKNVEHLTATNFIDLQNFTFVS